MDLESSTGDTMPNQNKIDDINALLKGGKPDEKPDPIQKIDGDDPHTGGDTDDQKPGLDSSATSDEKPDLADPQSDADSAEGDTDQPVTLKELAEAMELETKDLYDVEISIGKDLTVTLGELKDGHHELEKLRGEHAEFETRKTTQENETMVAKRQIEQLVELGVRTNSLHPEVIQRLETMHEETVTRERRAVFSVLPEWKDDVKRSADFEVIHEYANKYGFSRVEVEAVLDHRHLKMLRDASQRENQIKNAIPPKEHKLPADTGKGVRRKTKSSKLQDRIRSAKTGTRSEKLSVISDLLP